MNASQSLNTPVRAAAEGLPASNLNRRSFLRTMPIAGAAVALPAAALAMTAHERASHHYAEFAKAMNDLTADAHGWTILGGGERRAYEHLRGPS